MKTLRENISHALDMINTSHFRSLSREQQVDEVLSILRQDQLLDLVFEAITRADEPSDPRPGPWIHPHRCEDELCTEYGDLVDPGHEHHGIIVTPL